MAIGLHAADYVVIITTLVISAGIGLYFRFTGGRQRTTTEFLKAGKDMSILPVSFSLMATTISAASLLGTSADVYSHGFYIYVIFIGYGIGAFIAVYTMVPVFFDLDVCTTYEYLEKRFGKATRWTSSIFFCVITVFYSPLVLYAPALALSTVTGLSLWSAVLSMAAVCTFYSCLGGLKAVLWTDLFQALLMYAAAISVIIKICMEVGGISHAFELAKEGGRLSLFNPSTDFTERYTFLNCFILGVIGGLYTLGTWHVQIQRLMSMKNIERAKRTYLLSWPMSISYDTLTCLSGAVIYAYFYNCDPLQDKDSNIERNDQIYPYAVMKLFSDIPGMCGLCVAGIFSASLSSMSSFLNGLAAVSLEDFVKPLMKRRPLSESTATILAKIFVFVYAGLCVLLVFLILNDKSIFEASLVLGTLSLGPALGLFLLGMFTSTANETGSLIGFVVGLLVNIWLGFESLYKRPRDPSLPHSIAGCSATKNATSLGDLFEGNNTFVSDVRNSTMNFTLLIEEERYIFPLYKMSFMWTPILCFLIVMFVGYISSLLIGCWKSQSPVDPQNLSPIYNKFISRVPERKKTSIDAVELK